MGPMRRGAGGGVVTAVLLIAAVVVGSLLTWAVPAQAAGFAVRRQADLLPGVQVQALGSSSLSLNVGRVARGAPVRVEAVTAGAVGGGVETTSGVCRRVGGILCVNADFSECRACTTTFGGVVHDNVLQRSPVGGHEQLRLGPSGPGAGALGWSGALEATVTYVTTPPPVLGLLASPPTERVETVSLPLDALNRARGPGQVVLFTPPWGANTGTPGGGDEAVLGGGAASLGTNLGVDLRSLTPNVGSTPIPGDGMVVSSQGAGASRLRSFWAKATDPAASRRSVVLRTTVDKPAEESVGGHPVILANDREVIGGSNDPFATGRNPRTLVGWNNAGDLMLVTVDGRQPGSVGVSLVEAAGVLRQLGATNGFNLDGGGSTTFVSLPSGGRTPQVLNRPSDGTERRITTVLAVVPADSNAVRVSGSPAAAPPQPPPAPPGPPPADEASTDGLPARPRATPAPTTTTTTPLPPPTISPAPAVEPPVPDTAPPETAALEEAAPAPGPIPSKGPRPSTAIPAGVAAVALVTAAAATAATARKARRRARPGAAEPTPPA